MLSDPGEDYQPPYIEKWERDLNTTFTNEEVDRLIFFLHKASLSSKIQESN